MDSRDRGPGSCQDRMQANAPTSVMRNLNAPRSLAALVFVLLGYQLLTVWFTPLSALQHYLVHLTLVLAILSLEWSFVVWRQEKSPYRVIFPVATLLVVVYVGIDLFWHAEELQFSQPFLSTKEFVVAGLLVLSVLVLTFVVWGKFLATVCTLVILYFAFGYLLPEAIASRKQESFVVMSYLAGIGTTRGVNTFMPLSADTIFLLIVYGGLLHAAGCISMFVEFGTLLGRRLRGGVAYSAVGASSMVGMVTGQAVSNVALSGSMTIPTMMQRGFSGQKAGAIECLASNGSQLIPPIMGLGAFLMAAILGVSYTTVATAAILPAFLYIATFVLVLKAMIQADPQIAYEREKTPIDWGLVSWTLPTLVISLGMLIALLYRQYSGGMAASVGIALLVLMTYARPQRYRPSLTEMVNGFVTGAITAAKLALILAVIGMLVQTLITTGSSIQLARVMIDVTGGSVAIALMLAMGISLLIGMGLPTPAAYSLIAIVVVPSLIDVGLEPLVAHFFGFYFAIYSSITPPVAVAILTAVRISGAGLLSTAWECLKMGVACFLLPFVIVVYPSVLGFPHIDMLTMVMIASLLVATYMFGCAIYGNLSGRLSPAKRMTLLVGPASLLVHLSSGYLVFLAVPPLLLAMIVISQRFTSRAFHRREEEADLLD